MKINNQVEVIKNIMAIPYKKRKRLQSDCQRHAENNCNGVYWFDWDNQAYGGEHAEKGTALHNSIVKRLQAFGDFDSMPLFIQWQGDPRGFVLYFDSSLMTEEARAYCHDIGLMMDWGGNYAITTNSEQPKPKRHYRTVRND